MISGAQVVSLLSKRPLTIEAIEASLGGRGEWLGDGYNIVLPDPAAEEAVVRFPATSKRDKSATPSGIQLYFRRTAKETVRQFFPACQHWTAVADVSLASPYQYTCTSFPEQNRVKVWVELTGDVAMQESTIRRITYMLE